MRLILLGECTRLLWEQEQIGFGLRRPYTHCDPVADKLTGHAAKSEPSVWGRMPLRRGGTLSE